MVIYFCSCISVLFCRCYGEWLSITVNWSNILLLLLSYFWCFFSLNPARILYLCVSVISGEYEIRLFIIKPVFLRHRCHCSILWWLVGDVNYREMYAVAQNLLVLQTTCWEDCSLVGSWFYSLWLHRHVTCSWNSAAAFWRHNWNVSREKVQLSCTCGKLEAFFSPTWQTWLESSCVHSYHIPPAVLQVSILCSNVCLRLDIGAL